MTQLAETVDATDEVWTIDTLPASPFLQAGDELVEIRARYPEHIYPPTQETLPPKIRVRRALAGTSAASHNNGSTLTPVYVPSAPGEGGGAIAVTGTEGGSVAAATALELTGTVTDEGGGVAGYVPLGGEQTIRLLAAVPIAFDSPGLNNPVDAGMLIATVPAGVLVRAILLVNTIWDVGGQLQIAIGDPSGVDIGTAGIGTFDPGNTGVNAWAVVETAPRAASGIGAVPRWARTLQEAGIYAMYFPDADDPTEGGGDIYVLIAEPAA